MHYDAASPAYKLWFLQFQLGKRANGSMEIKLHIRPKDIDISFFVNEMSDLNKQREKFIL